MDEIENELPIPSSLRFRVGSVVTPGDRIGSSSQLFSGPGTYAKGLHVYSSLAGTLHLSSPPPPTSKSHESEKRQQQQHSYQASVSITFREKLSSKTQTNLIPSLHQNILGRIVRISTQQATVEILASRQSQGPFPAPHSFGGILRKEDIRKGATEDIVMGDYLQPGDVVLAKVISLGDARRYFLTIVDNDLGVIRAVCRSSGERMVPVSWREMECPVTRVRELRKCARPCLEVNDN